MKESKTKAYGKSLVFGVVEIKYLQGVPHGAKVRFRMRNDSFLKAFVKDTNGITQYHVEVRDGKWFPCLASARNIVVNV